MAKRSEHDPRTVMPIGMVKHVNDWLVKRKFKHQKIEVYENEDKLITYFKIPIDKKGLPDVLNVDKVFLTIKLKKSNKQKI